MSAHLCHSGFFSGRSGSSLVDAHRSLKSPLDAGSASSSASSSSQASSNHSGTGYHSGSGSPVSSSRSSFVPSSTASDTDGSAGKLLTSDAPQPVIEHGRMDRSEERRVGKESR